MIDVYNTIVGTISLVVGGFSLYYSIVGYNQAKTAKEESEKVKHMLEKMNYVKEVRMSFQEELAAINIEEKRSVKADKLFSLLRRIQLNEPEWNKLGVNNAISALEVAIPRLHNENSWDVGGNTKAMSNGIGIVNAYVDKLGEKISEISEAE